MGIYQALCMTLGLGLQALCCLCWAVVSGMIYHMQIVSGGSTFHRAGVGLSSTDTPTQTVFCIRHTSISHPTHMNFQR